MTFIGPLQRQFGPVYPEAIRVYREARVERQIERFRRNWARQQHAQSASMDWYENEYHATERRIARGGAPSRRQPPDFTRGWPYRTPAENARRRRRHWDRNRVAKRARALSDDSSQMPYGYRRLR